MKILFGRIVLVSSLVFITAHNFAQPRRAQILQSDIASGYGSVENLEGEIFEGDVKFNDNAGVVTVEANGQSKSFTAKKAIRFSFDDSSLSRQRIFHVFDYNNEDTGFTSPAFFEVLGEFPTFAVLAKIDPVEAKPKKGIMPRPANTMTSTQDTKVAFQKETIFFMNEKGELEPYVELREKETEGIYVDTRSNRKKFVDRDLLQQYAGVLFPKLEAFAQANDLSFKIKEDLVKILAHYKQLLQN